MPPPLETKSGGLANDMTLRDAAALASLAGITANPAFFGSIFQQSPIAAAAFAREAADALIERERGE